MKIIKANPGDFIAAGQQGEELARRVEFDISEWERLYGPGTVQLIVKRMTDETFYPTSIEQEQGVAVWNVTVPETSVAGKYHTYELRYYARETLAKAVGGLFSINEAFVGDEGDVPEVHQGWVDQIIATGAGSLAAQKAAETARDEAVEAQLNANLANTEAQAAKQEVSSQTKRAETAANAAEESEKNAKSSEDAAVKAAEEAENSERNAIEAARQAELSKDGIVQAEANASQYAAAAAKSAADASVYRSNAQTYMRGAETARSQAQTSAQAASNSSMRAEESEAAAKQSEVNAAKSAQEAKEAAQNAGGGVSSWNDLTDKPFYEETKLVELLKESVLDLTKGGNLDLPYSLGLVVGQTYIVKWNGVEYEMVAREVQHDGSQRIVGIGRGYDDQEEEDKPCGFFDKGNLTEVISFDGYDYFECSIKGEQTVIVPLPAKYLPKGVPYIEESMVEILPECQLTWNEDEGAFILNNTLGLTGGNTYTVNWNGTEYVCTAVSYAIEDGSKVVLLGNQAVGGEEDSGEPFGIMDIVYAGVTMCVPMDGSSSVTISIKQGGTTIRKIDTRCLLDGTPYVKENVLLEERIASSFTHPSFGKMWAIYGGVPNLTVGETYTITYNGVDYRCVCQPAPAGLIADPNAVAMGNFSVVGGANTGEPFAMLVSYAGQEVDIIDLAGSSAVKVGISRTEVQKMDERCLPDTVATKADIFGAMEASY